MSEVEMLCPAARIYGCTEITAKCNQCCYNEAIGHVTVLE